LIVPELTVSRLATIKVLLETKEDEISWNLELTKDSKKIEWR